MSELSSLFVKLRIKKENLERFLAAEKTIPVVDQDWNNWWDSREMYSKSPLTEIPVYRNAGTNEEIFETYFDQLDLNEDAAATGVYYFASVMFTENYYESLPMLAALKSIASYMEAGDEGVAFIYDYVWGSKQVMAHVELHAGQAVMKTTSKTTGIDKALMKEADEVMKRAIDNFSGEED